jgi:hypothetical protein
MQGCLQQDREWNADFHDCHDLRLPFNKKKRWLK